MAPANSAAETAAIANPNSVTYTCVLRAPPCFCDSFARDCIFEPPARSPATCFPLSSSCCHAD
jgi:hypothetical protein